MKVLIIDDSSTMRRIHRNILLEAGCKDEDIIDAEDGEKALQLANSNNIGLFIVDWNMPHLNGLQFVKIIRSMEKYSLTPVVMITSEAAKYNVMEAITSGVTNYIVKPVKAEIFLEKISKYLT